MKNRNTQEYPESPGYAGTSMTDVVSQFRRVVSPINKAWDSMDSKNLIPKFKK